MVDRYTKSALTVIAVALVGLLAVQVEAALTPAAHAQGSSPSCGIYQPCQVVWYNALPVRVQP